MQVCMHFGGEAQTTYAKFTIDGTALSKFSEKINISYDVCGCGCGAKKQKNKNGHVTSDF